MQITLRKIVNALFFMLFFSFSSHSMACKCINYSDDAQEAVKTKYDMAKSVVLAEVLAVKKIKIKDAWDDNVTELDGELTYFLAHQSWKGKQEEYFATKIVTQCCVCGMSFEQGKKYLLYLRETEEKAVYTTSACSGNKLFEQAQDEINYLNQIAPKK